MRKIVLFYLMMLITSSSLCLTACDDESSIMEEPNQSNTNSGNGSGGSRDIASIVNDRTSCTSSYSDYHVNITLNHSILSELPSASISYVVGHAERGDTVCWVIDGYHAITPTVTSSGNVTNVKIQFPFYYYFVVKLLEDLSYSDREYYSNALAECELYLYSYLALKNKPSMSASERDFYNKLKKYLNEYQNEVRGSYTVWIYIKINGKDYLVKAINI